MTPKTKQSIPQNTGFRSPRVKISAEAYRRVFGYAALLGRAPGDVISELVIMHLPAVTLAAAKRV